MSRLVNILQQEYKTKGLFSGAASSLGKRTLEKLDVRNALFSGGGLGSVIGTKIFGKGYSATRRAGTGKGTSPNVLTSDSSSLLQDININSKITAKNSMALPAMAKQMNIMQKNIAKLVTTFGEKPSTKADSFFSNAKFRENAYESQFSSNKKPTRVETAKEKSGGAGGILGILGSVVGGISSAISSAISGIATVITSAITTLGSTIISAITALGTILASALIGKSLKNSIPPILSDTPGSDRNKKGEKTDKKERRIPQRDPKTGRFMKAAPPSSGKYGGRAAGVLGGLMIFDAATGGTLSSIIDYDDDRVWAISSDFEKTPYFDNITDDEMGQFLEFLGKKKYDEAKGYYKSLGAKYGYTLKSKGGVSGFLGAEQWVKSPTPLVVPSTSSNVGPSPTKPISDEQKKLGMMYKASKASGSAASSSTTPSRTNTNLLDLIASGESGKAGYDAANKGKAGDTPGGMPGLSNMKVGDVMRLQQEKKLFAAGRYQIIPNTLAELIKGTYGNTGVSLNDTFDAATQDKLVTALINKRLQQGGDDPIKQQYALSQEFASIANPYTNSSYYDKVGNNKASIGTSTIQAALSGSPSGTVLASNRSSSGETLASASEASFEGSKNMFTPEDLASLASIMGSQTMIGGGGGLSQVSMASKATPYPKEFYNGLITANALG